MTVAIDVLGPLRLRIGNEERTVGGRRERLLLALLATAAGRHVGDDRLVDELWGDEPPAAATNSLQVAVSRLRRVFGEHAELRRDPAGYTLLGADVDAVTVAELTERLADLDPAEILDATAGVLSLWRGKPFAGLGEAPTLAAETVRLEEARLTLVESRAAAFLALGRSAEAHRLLASVVGDHPFRERLWSLLALALYRSQRQADALETLRTLRTALVEELGVDPSASVRTLEAQMLAHDPALDARPPTTRDPDATRARVSGVVGRSEALAVIDAALTDLVDEERGGLLLITGDAGIGKTMLAVEAAHRAGSRGARVAIGRCHEADLAPPYWPWLPVLRDLADTEDPVPAEVRALLEGGIHGASATDAGAAAATTLRTFAAVSRLLGIQGRPLVVLLEDLHWADHTSLRLLAYAAEELRGRPVLFVATVRTVDPRRHPVLAQALAGLARLEARRVPVPPLSNEAVTALLEDVLVDPDPALVEVLTRRTDGNPFFVLEMARLLGASGRATAAAAEHLEVPDGVADVLRMRVLQLAESTRTALSLASVVGRTFDTRLLTAALGEAVLDDLDEAVAARIVEETDIIGQLRFVHALTRETVYGDLPLGRRARWHAQVGRALAERLARDPDLIGEVAHHHTLAAPYLPELAEDAVGFGRRAALAAEARGAFDEALALWTRTIEVEREIPEPDRARRHTLLLSLSTARQRLGDLHGMLATLDEAIGLARESEDYTRMAEAATSFRSSGVWHWREIGSDDPRAVEVLELCLEHVEDTGLRARILANLGLEHTVASRHEEADRCGRRSIELARASGDRQVLRDCLVARELALWSPFKAEEREVCARESVVVADTDEYLMTARFRLATALHFQGRVDEADSEMAPVLDLAARLGHTGSDVPLGWWRWMRAVEAEDPDAVRIGRETLALHRRTTVVALTELTGLYTIVSAPHGAPVPPDVVASAINHPFLAFRAAVASALCLAGEVDAGVRILGTPTEVGGDYAGLFAACLTVDVLAAAGHPGLSAAVEVLRPFADSVATYGSVQSLGSVACFIGSGLVALGRLDEGRAMLERAVVANARVGCLRWERIARQRLAALDPDRLSRAQGTNRKGTARPR
ncbi:MULTISPECIES: ATP-binding protein [Nocardioides]|uniref:ATP-binding protein n=1 Tax=Nocardioides vastitatis TaxID=2568655 RepID=A0ABW0ZHF7_9ACTN|nr:BTAD domain-containing putative transcriptional regulator [Nocardioides sp.]